LLVALLGGRLQREQEDVLAFRREENRVLKARLDEARHHNLGRPRPYGAGAPVARLSRTIRPGGERLPQRPGAIATYMVATSLIENLSSVTLNVNESMPTAPAFGV